MSYELCSDYATARANASGNNVRGYKIHDIVDSAGFRRVDTFFTVGNYERAVQASALRKGDIAIDIYGNCCCIGLEETPLDTGPVQIFRHPDGLLADYKIPLGIGIFNKKPDNIKLGGLWTLYQLKAGKRSQIVLDVLAGK